MKKINIAELLKDCPSDMELDCTIYEDVYFDYVDELNIIHCYIQCENYKTSITFNQHGTPNSDIKSKCVIFPKGKTTWEGFVPPCGFKDGDVVISDYGNIHLLRTKDSSYCSYRQMNKNKLDITITTRITVVRLATEEEKQKLFDAIKSNGYHWNAETKTLEKLIEPKFKVGDRVRNKNYKDYIYTIHDIVDKGYRAKEINADCPIVILFGSQEDNYELVPNKFDINTLVPFESKVLVRDKNNDKWIGQFFSHYDNGSDRPYVCIGIEGLCEYKKCIPFKNNEYLLGKTDDCDEYYKTW